MRLPVVLLEVMLTVLMVTIGCRAFFPLKNTGRFLAAPYFLCAGMIWGLWLLPDHLGILPSAAVIAIYVLCLFQAERWRLLLFLLIFGAVYTLVFLLCGWYIEACMEGLLARSAARLCAFLLSELLLYNGLLIGRVLMEKRRIPITYFFPCIPLLMTLACIHFFQPAAERYSTLVLAFLLVLFSFDFVCLALQSYLIALLRNRSAIRSELVRQEILENRYQILKEQYQASFEFLHGLLRSCADLSVDIEEKDLERIHQEVSRIASRSFAEFNNVCISTPVLSEILEQKKNQIEEQQILVSTVLRSDHFGLLTFEEQRHLFSSLIDFALGCIARSGSSVKTLVIKSLQDGKDIVLYLRFPGTETALSSSQFRKLRQSLSKKFRAGLQGEYDKEQHIISLMLIMPLASSEVSWLRSEQMSENQNSVFQENHFLPHADL